MIDTYNYKYYTKLLYKLINTNKYKDYTKHTEWFIHRL